MQPIKYIRIMLALIVTGFLSVFAGFIILSPMLGRGDDYIIISGGTRLRILLDALKGSGFWSKSFGIGTNSAQLLGISDIAVDSIYASIVINLGWGTFLVVVAIIIYNIVKYRFNKRNTAFILMYCLYGATTIFLEAFPMNYLFPLLIVAYFKYPYDIVNFKIDAS
jgi:hypothetical protein